LLMVVPRDHPVGMPAPAHPTVPNQEA